MKQSQSGWWDVIGLVGAILACIGFWIVVKTAAWSVWSVSQRVALIGYLIVAHSAAIMVFVHIERNGIRDGFASGLLLFALGTVPFGHSFYYLFLGPSYGGMAGGIGAAIALLQFAISGAVVLSGVMILRRMLQRMHDKRRLERQKQTAEPGATDNPGDAQRSREGH